jgi:hypothetical protein
MICILICVPLMARWHWGVAIDMMASGPVKSRFALWLAMMANPSLLSNSQTACITLIFRQELIASHVWDFAVPGFNKLY